MTQETETQEGKRRKRLALSKIEYFPDENPFWQTGSLNVRRRRVYKKVVVDDKVAQKLNVRLIDEKTKEEYRMDWMYSIEPKDDDQFVKVFCDLAIFDELSLAGYKVFHAVLREYAKTKMRDGYVDTVYIAWFKGGINGEETNMSKSTFLRGMNELLENNVIYGKRPNLYWINPVIFFKGDRAKYLQDFKDRHGDRT